MSIIGLAKLLGKAALGTTKMAAHTTFQGGVGARALLGAGIGSGVGYYNTESDDPNAKFEGLAKGAFLGALGGASISAIRPMTKIGIGVGRSKVGQSIMQGTAKMIGNTALGVARFAYKHPLVTVGGIGATYLTYDQLGSTKSPTLTGQKVNTNYEMQSIAATNLTPTGRFGTGFIGAAPTMLPRMSRAMIESTENLVQGLHRGRHG